MNEIKMDCIKMDAKLKSGKGYFTIPLYFTQVITRQGKYISSVNVRTWYPPPGLLYFFDDLIYFFVGFQADIF